MLRGHTRLAGCSLLPPPLGRLTSLLDRVQFRLKLGDPCELQILITPQLGDLRGHLIDQHAEAFVRAPDASPLSGRWHVDGMHVGNSPTVSKTESNGKSGTYCAGETYESGA